MIEVNYTTISFLHDSNDINNNFSLPSVEMSQGHSVDNARFKGPDKERMTITISSTTDNMLYTATRFRVRNSTGVDTNGYVYFVDSVIKNNDGSVVIELSLDYFLTYYLTTFFGTNTTQWFGNADSIPFMLERSHLMPDPSMYLGQLGAGGNYRLVYGDIYVLLLQTLKRVDFDIAGYINQVIYSNKNFLQVAVGNTDCQLGAISKYTYNSLTFTGHVPWIATETTVGNMSTNGTSDSVDIYVSKNMESYTYSFAFNDLITPFNNTTTGIVMPGPVASNMRVNNFRTSGSTMVSWINDDLSNNYTTIRGRTFIIPAPINSDIYKAYNAGTFSGTGAILVDIPLPHIVMLANKCYQVAGSSISDNLFDVGMYGVDNVNSRNGAVGLIFNQNTFIIENLLTKVLGNSTQKTGLTSVETKPEMNKGVTYLNGKDFLGSYRVNQDTTDFFLLKGLNSIYFTFKQGYLCFNFQDYNSFGIGSDDVALMINLIGFNVSIISKGDIFRGGNPPSNYGYDDSNTQGITQGNTTLTKGYSQGLSLIPNDSKYADIMNTKYNSLNTSLANTRNQTVMQSILGGLGILGGTAGITYGITKKSVNSFVGGAFGAMQGASNIFNSAIRLGNAYESYNSYLKDSINANSGYLFQNDIPAIPALPTATQVVLNKLGQVRLGNGVNRNGYDIREVFSARHIAMNNMKGDKYVDPNGSILNISNKISAARYKYGYLKFYDFCTENIKFAIIDGFQLNKFVVASSHVEGGVQLLVNGLRFNTMTYINA